MGWYNEKKTESMQKRKNGFSFLTEKKRVKTNVGQIPISKHLAYYIALFYFQKTLKYF